MTDVLGTHRSDADAEGDRKPRFVRHFGNVAAESRRAVEGYVEAVRSGGFPEVGKETYGMKKEEWEGFLRLARRAERSEER